MAKKKSKRTGTMEKQPTAREHAAFYAANTIINGVLAGETVKEVKWIDQNSDEKIGMSMARADGMRDMLTRILVRFVNGYEDGIRYVVTDGGVMVHGELPVGLDENAGQDVPEKYADLRSELMAEFLAFTKMDVPVPFTPVMN